MKFEQKRIFISNLPDDVSSEIIENSFKDYGQVVSVEIKKRKETSRQNSSLHFSYVNIITDDINLQKCFKKFNNEKWHGHFVTLQLARESFLERLKRERAESNIKNCEISEEKSSTLPEEKLEKEPLNELKTNEKNKSFISYNGTGIFKNDEEEKIEKVSKVKKKKHKIDEIEQCEIELKDDNETFDLVVKNNKDKFYEKDGLKIPSVGNKPIIKIEQTKPLSKVNSSEANLKRLESLKNLKRNYQNQKSVIQRALSKIDCNSSIGKKIIFDSEVDLTSTEDIKSTSKQNNTKRALFEDDQFEDDFVADFTVKQQFQGSEGQKLMKLQSKYKNDKRFILDPKFLDEDLVENTEINTHDQEDVEMSVEEEKRNEYKILEEVLGKNVSKYRNIQKIESKSMLRFDPTQPEHSKYELKTEIEKPSKKKKRKNSDMDLIEEKNQEVTEVPEVSKEVFYKVRDDLKEALHEKQEFSLLGMFGKSDEIEAENSNDAPKDIKTNNFVKEKNPFRYDSSDDEDKTEDISDKNDTHIANAAENIQNKINRNPFVSEPFFFRKDDFRLQEGSDFIEKMKMDMKDQIEFTKLRRTLKEIVKSKVRNNQSKHKPFKKKLGGSKRKKMIKIKKALKR